MTNSEKIRNMNDSELCELLICGNFAFGVPYCTRNKGYCNGCADECLFAEQQYEVMTWLGKETDNNGVWFEASRENGGKSWIK